MDVQQTGDGSGHNALSSEDHLQDNALHDIPSLLECYMLQAHAVLTVVDAGDRAGQVEHRAYLHRTDRVTQMASGNDCKMCVNREDGSPFALLSTP